MLLYPKIECLFRVQSQYYLNDTIIIIIIILLLDREKISHSVRQLFSLRIHFNYQDIAFALVECYNTTSTYYYEDCFLSRTPNFFTGVCIVKGELRNVI